MSQGLHRKAELLMADADLHISQGRLHEASSCWLQAARCEAAAFAQIPKDRGKTRGIIAVNAVALFRDAGALNEAVRLAEEYLATGELPEAWQAELAALFPPSVFSRHTSRPGGPRAQDVESLARGLLMFLMTRHTGVETTEESLNEILAKLTIELGALPRFGQIVQAVTFADSVQIAKVANALITLLRQKPSHYTFEAARDKPEAIDPLGSRPHSIHESQSPGPVEPIQKSLLG